MLKRFKLLLLAPVFFLAMGLAPALVLADCTNPASTAEAIQCGANSSAGVPASSDPGGQLDKTVENIVNLISLVVGIAAVVMIMVGGFRYTASGGKEDSVKAAKSTIIYALVGLIVVALAQVVVRFVLHKTIPG